MACSHDSDAMHQHVIAVAEKLHSHSICPSRSMQLHDVEDWLTHCSIWDYVSPMTGCCNSCPPKLRRGLLTTGAVDNIDHNPSSTTAKDSFHCTGISLMQHQSHTHGGTDCGIYTRQPHQLCQLEAWSLLHCLESDLYFSLKASTREKRGKSTRKRLLVMPKNWADFLRVNENKTELFTFLSHEVIDLLLDEGKKCM